MGSNKRHGDQVYEEGVRDGQRANGLDQIVHAQTKWFAFPSDRRDNDTYNAGFDYGVTHKPQPSSEVRSSPTTNKRLPEEGRAGYHSAASGSDSDGLEGFAALCGFIGAVFGFVKALQAGGIGLALGWAFLGFIGGALAGVVIVVILCVAAVAGTIYCIIKVLAWFFG